MPPPTSPSASVPGALEHRHGHQDDERPYRWDLRTIAGRVRGLLRWGARPLRGERQRVTNRADAGLRHLLHEHGQHIARELGDPRPGSMFEQQMLNTWQTTLRRLPGGRTFVITGDIPAMWLRDSSAQLRPFLMLANESDLVREVVTEVVAQQWDLVAIDPYANAFNATEDAATWHALDLPAHPRVWERKYEIDSLAFPVQLAWQLWRITGSHDHLTPAVHEGLRRVVQVYRREQRHEALSSYRFVRPGTDDTLPRNGRGAPVAECGMTWSAFRPSDDPCRFGYNVPAQLMAVHALRLGAQLCAQVFDDPDLCSEALTLAAEIADAVADHGVIHHAGRVAWAYEVDALGGVLVGDDANMPSLLSLPLTAGIALDDPLYLSTRDLVLSPANPWYVEGRAAQGIGSPHTPGPMVWPIALAVQALTSTDPAEQRRLVRTLAATDAGTGLMHESFDVDDPQRFTRPWFSWANSMFCELLLSLTGPSLADLAAAGPGGPTLPAAPAPRLQ